MNKLTRYQQIQAISLKWFNEDGQRTHQEFCFDTLYRNVAYLANFGRSPRWGQAVRDWQTTIENAHKRFCNTAGIDYRRHGWIKRNDITDEKLIAEYDNIFTWALFQTLDVTNAI